MAPSPSPDPLPQPAPFSIRPARPDDDRAIAAIVADVAAEFGYAAVRDDPDLRSIANAYPGGWRQFFVVESDGRVLGCGGFAPLAGSNPNDAIAELRMMYFRPELRGRGAGRTLVRHLLEAMLHAGYRLCYLETATSMAAARKVYEAAGFRQISNRRGAAGGRGCDRYYLKQL